MFKLHTLALAAGAALLAAASPAVAQQAIASNTPSLCLAGNGGSLTSCNPAANRFTRQYISGRNAYVIRSSDGGCLDGYQGKGKPVETPGCDGTKDQDWWVNAYGQIQNQANRLCVDVEGGKMSQGARVIMWDCHGGANQKFLFGTVKRESSLTRGTPIIQASSLGNLSINGNGVVAPGGANVVAAGGANVVAPGGANVIAAGGGNVIAPGGGN